MPNTKNASDFAIYVQCIGYFQGEPDSWKDIANTPGAQETYGGIQYLMKSSDIVKK